MVRPIHTGYLDGGGMSNHQVGSEPRCPGCRDYLAAQPPPLRPFRFVGVAFARLGRAVGWACSRFRRRVEVDCPQGAREGRPHLWGSGVPGKSWPYGWCTCCAGRRRGHRTPHDPGPPPTRVFPRSTTRVSEHGFGIRDGSYPDPKQGGRLER